MRYFEYCVIRIYCKDISFITVIPAQAGIQVLFFDELELDSPLQGA